MSATTCTYDSGSATGCRPLCDARAVWSVTYRNGSGPALVALVCDRHLSATRARVYPALTSVVRLEWARVHGGDDWPWPLGLHGPGRWAMPCPGVPFTDGTDRRTCSHPAGDHGPHGCEHAGYGSGDSHSPDSVHMCPCSATWHGGTS